MNRSELLGSLRHEIDHHYWRHLVDDGDDLAAFRIVFGDERADYGTALHRYYTDGGVRRGRLDRSPETLVIVAQSHRSVRSAAMCAPLPRHRREDRAAVVVGRRGQCEVRGHPVNVRPVGDLDGFGVEFQAEGRDVLVRVVGEVDAATAPLLSAELDRARDHSDGDVRVDLAAVTFFDCAALRALVHARSGLTKQGRRLVVTDPAPTARRVFELTGLLGILQPEASPGRY